MAFPFPVKPSGLLGRFLASGARDPGQALSHLVSSRPIFLEIANIFESLRNPKRSWLILHDPAKDEAKSTAESQPRSDSYSINGTRYERLVRCLEVSDDISGRGDGRTETLCPIVVPRLPSVAQLYTTAAERQQFAIEYLDWVMTGDASGKLIARRAISRDEERVLEHRVRQLADARKTLKKHLAKPPADDAKPYLVDRWNGHAGELECRVGDLAREVSDLKSRHRKAKTVVRLLEDDQSLAPDVRAFRAAGGNSAVAQQLRAFSIDDGNVNESVRLLLEKLSASRVDPRVGPVVDILLAALQLPGISTRAELHYLTEQWSQATAILDRLLEYAFEHATKITESDLTGLLGLLAAHRVKLPESCRAVAVGRFRITPGLIDDFNRFADSYRPAKLGDPPKMFEDRASFCGRSR